MSRRRWRRLGGGLATLLGCLAVATPSSAEYEVDHTLWDQLLKRHVKQGLVDYQGFRDDEKILNLYLAMIRVPRVERMSKPEQLTFWINAYNAYVIRGVLDHDPLESVKDVSGFFDGTRHHVAAFDVTLDEMEKKGRALGDFRIHFALVCASRSCPPLRAEAYLPERLDAQLDEQARLFLSDPARGARLEGEILWLSQIFKWFKGDFTKSRLPAAFVSDTAIVSAIEPYLDPAVRQTIHEKTLTVRFMDYNWSLNGVTQK